MEKMDTFIRQESMDELSLGFCEKLYAVNGFISQESEEKQIWQECLPKKGKRAFLQSSEFYKSKMAGRESESDPVVN